MKILDLGKPEKIGYYQMKGISSCSFKLFSNSIVAEAKLKTNPGSYKAVLGNVFHDLISKLSGITDSAERIRQGKKIIDDEYCKLAKMDEYWWLEPLFSYSETSKLLSAVVNLSFNQRASSNEKSKFEVEISSGDLMFAGRVDKIIELPEELILHEYKSSVISDLDQFVIDHKPQLEFYAGIILEKNKVKKIRGELFSNSLIPISIEMNTEEVVEKMRLNRDFIGKIQSESHSVEKLQNPSVENCLDCKLKPVCKGFCESVSSFGNYDGAIVRGKLASIVQRNSNFSVISLKEESKIREVVISNFHPFCKKAITGQDYTFANVRQNSSSYEILRSSVIYDR